LTAIDYRCDLEVQDMGKKSTTSPSAAAPGSPHTGPGTIDPTPNELTEAITERRCAVFVGAGLSVGAGYPNWENLLKGLIRKSLQLKNISDHQAGELQQLVNTKEADKYLLVAQELSDRFGHERFVDEIVAVFGDETKRPTAAHDELTRIKFDFAITTNYDRLIEQSYAKAGLFLPPFMHSSAPDFIDKLWRRKFFILKAHGDVDHKSEIVITERDYRNIIFRSKGYQSALAAIFTTRTMLFIGVSLSDPETKLLLAYLHDAFHGSGARHYALVPRSQFTQTVVSRWGKDYRVDCIL
jgi:SIR2-like domain